ncbi:hypothetical protein [Dickeya ananatis]
MNSDYAITGRCPDDNIYELTDRERYGDLCRSSGKHALGKQHAGWL